MSALKSVSDKSGKCYTYEDCVIIFVISFKIKTIIETIALYYMKVPSQIPSTNTFSHSAMIERPPVDAK